MASRWRSTCLTLMALGPAARSLAQEPRRIPDGTACARCTIEIAPVVTLGDKEGGGMLPGRPQAIIQDGRGRYWVVAEWEPPRVYDSDGRFVTTVGRKGTRAG
jgi:hypothetical protein